jgi:hypothetical protein
MRTTTRILLAGIVSVLVVGIAPVQSAGASPLKPGMVYCCR